MEVWFGVDPDTGGGGVLAASVTWVNETTLEVVTPAHAPGHVDLLVLSMDSGQADTLTNGFQYKAPQSSGGACFSVSPPPDAGHGLWITFFLGLALIAMGSQVAMSGRLRPRSVA
jgi:hypothetical protein